MGGYNKIISMECCVDRIKYVGPGIISVRLLDIDIYNRIILIINNGLILHRPQGSAIIHSI